jgi:hypothetical protein
VLFKHNSAILNTSVVILFLILIFPQHLYTQSNYEKSFYGGLFFISEYISSDYFQSLKTNYNDLELVDSIYIKALEFFNYDYSETFLCLTFATLPYNSITIKFFFNTQLKIPLPSTPKKIFDKKVAHLPQKLFFNSPQNNFGDKDKLAHFFGNAFLRYNFGWFNLSKFMGIFVEHVEEKLFFNGSISGKDIVINHFGELFAETVKINNKILPSDVLNIYQLLFLRIHL